MAKYNAVCKDAAGRVIHASGLRSYKGEAVADAESAFRNPAVQTAELRRWHKPRVGHAGQVDSWESGSGREYDQVVLEVNSRG